MSNKVACLLGAIALLATQGVTAADEVFTKTAVIQIPGGLNSFDISFVDAQIARYFLADRTNAAIDMVDTGDITKPVKQLGKGAFVGVQPGSDTSGPNGVITAND